VRDIQAITLTLRQRSIQETAGKGPTREENLGSFLCQAFFTGSQAVNDIACVQQQKGIPDLTSKQQREIFYDATTEHTTRMCSNLSGDAVELLQEQFGRGTTVQLPSRDTQFDTRVITGNIDFHAKNNRINAQPATLKHANGMIDNLRPDYTNLGPRFQHAAVNPINLANTIPSIDSKFFTRSPTHGKLSPAVPFAASASNSTEYAPVATASPIDLCDSSSSSPRRSFQIKSKNRCQAKKKTEIKNLALSSDGYFQPHHFDQLD